MSLETFWRRIEDWTRSVGLQEDLPSPASLGEIRQAGETLGIAIPREMTESLLIHDGSAVPILPPFYEVLSVTRVVAEWKIKQEVAAASHLSFSREFIPFAADTAGNILYIDGAEGGTRIYECDKFGQDEITNDHAMWQSIEGLLCHVADALEIGYRLDCFERPDESTGFRRWHRVADSRFRRRAIKPHHAVEPPDQSAIDEIIRQWARANGYSVNDRGRIPSFVRKAYEASL